MLLPDRPEPVAYGKRAAQRRAQVEIGVCDRASAKRPSSAILVFDDDAGTPVGNNSVLSGLFNPVKAISAFNGEDSFGDWAINIFDDVGVDPKPLASFAMSIATDISPVPLPAGLPLLAVGLAAFGCGPWRFWCSEAPQKG